MALSAHNSIDIHHYLDIEKKARVRYEYHRGELYAMSGGSIQHSMLCANVAGALRDELRKQRKQCFTFTSEVKVEIARDERYVYPDAAVVCGKINESTSIKGAIRNPRVVVEVISESSGDYDRGAKMRYYLGLPTLREYVLVDQDRAHVTVYRQEESGELGSFHYADGLEASVELASLGIVIPMQEIYLDVDFPLPKKED